MTDDGAADGGNTEAARRGTATTRADAGDDEGPDSPAQSPDEGAVPAALTRRPAASLGTAVGAVALLGAVLTWTDSPGIVPAVAGLGSSLGAVFALGATAAFLARRHGLVPGREGATAAGLASAAVLATAVVRFFGPAAGGGTDPTVGVGLPLAAVAGGVGVALALADARAVPAGALAEMGRRGAVGMGLVVGAFAVQYAVAVVLIGVHAAVGSPLDALQIGPSGGIVASVVVADVVFAGVAVGFLLATGRGLGYVDVARPDVRDLVYAGVGVVGLFVVLVALRLVVLGLDLPATSNNITRAAMEGHPETLLVLIPLSFLFIGPAEELLNRNVIQKYLYGPFSRLAAVVVASAIFASAHVFSYSGDTTVGLAVSLTNIFVLSLVLGVVYERTENIVVPVFVHGFFNAVQFLLLYVAIVYGDAAEQLAVALPP